MLTAENYYTPESDREYMSASLYKSMAGTYGYRGCEFRAMEKLAGRWQEEPNEAMLIGSYVDSKVEGEDSFKQFTDEHPEIFKQNGDLKAPYVMAEKMYQRIKEDSYFWSTLSGEHQTIMTGELFGAKWKIKMDSYLPHYAIVDLKTVARIDDFKYAKDIGYMDFISYWGYDTQLAIYQKIVAQNTGEILPCYISAVSKEKEPNIEVIHIGQNKLNEALSSVEMHMNRVIDVWKNGAIPDRCGQCGCCHRNKKLTGYIEQDEIIPAL